MNELLDFNLGDIHIPDIMQRTVFIIGGKGSGKTKTLKMMAYTFLQDEIPVYIFDPLAQIKIDGFKIITINKKMCAEAALIKTAKLPTILEKTTDKHIIFHFKQLLSEEIVAWANIFFGGWHPHDVMILVDEAQEFAPERGMGLEYSGDFERAVRHWRNQNVGFVMATQRPAFTSKKVLGLLDELVLYRVTYNNDLKVVKELINNKLTGEESQKVLSQLQTSKFLEGVQIAFI